MDPCAFNPQVRNSGEVAMVERICAGQSQLYLSLIEPYERAVFVSAYCILQSEADAEEVAFEAIRNGFIRLPALRAEEHFGVWLIHIAVQEARMRLSNNRSYNRDSSDGISDNYGRGRGEEDTYIPRDFSEWRKIHQEELQEPRVRTALRVAVASLALKYRAVFVLRDILNMNVAEIAMVLEISEVSVKARLLRAHLELRDILAVRFARARV